MRRPAHRWVSKFWIFRKCNFLTRCVYTVHKSARKTQRKSPWWIFVIKIEETPLGEPVGWEELKVQCHEIFNSLFILSLFWYIYPLSPSAPIFLPSLSNNWFHAVLLLVSAESLIPRISPRKRNYLQINFNLLIRGLGGFDSWKRMPWHNTF